MSSPRLPGIGAHHSANPQTDEWLTPPDVLQAVRGDRPFDLDPCAPHDRPDWTRCARSYTASDDGLSLPWEGEVWCNPPYSAADAWCARLAQHGDGMALVFARAETRWWFESVWPHATSLLFLAGRLSFWRLAPGASSPVPSKSGHNSGGPSVLIAYGAASAQRLASCGLPGSLVTGWAPSGP